MYNDLDHLTNFLSINSTAGKPAELRRALEYVAGQVEACAGITVEYFEQNDKPSFLAYRGSQRPERFSVLLNGHVDVVPGKPEQFVPVQKGDQLYARGALDMKAAALVLTQVFCDLAAKVPYPLGLQIVSDEEVGGHNGTAYQLAQGVRANFAIAGEFTQPGQICVASRGICQAKVRVHGTTAHSAYPWNGDNAAVRAAAYVQKLLASYPIPPEQIWATTVNVSGISAPHAAINAVPEAAEIVLDCRYIPGDANFASREAAQTFLAKLDPQVSVEILMYEPAHEADTQNVYVRKLAAALQTATGLAPEFIKKPGGADVRFYSDLGVPAVVLGVQGADIHGDNEHLLLPSLDQYYKTLKKFLLSVPN